MKRKVGVPKRPFEEVLPVVREHLLLNPRISKAELAALAVGVSQQTITGAHVQAREELRSQGLWPPKPTVPPGAGPAAGPDPQQSAPVTPRHQPPKQRPRPRRPEVPPEGPAQPATAEVGPSRPGQPAPTVTVDDSAALMKVTAEGVVKVPWPEAIEMLPTAPTALLAMTTWSPISVAHAAVGNKVQSDTAAQAVRETVRALEAVASFGGTTTDSGRHRSLNLPELFRGGRH